MASHMLVKNSARARRPALSSVAVFGVDPSIAHADIAAHIRIVVLALIAAIVVVTVGIAARTTPAGIRLSEPATETAPAPSGGREKPAKPVQGRVVLA